MPSDAVNRCDLFRGKPYRINICNIDIQSASCRRFFEGVCHLRLASRRICRPRLFASCSQHRTATKRELRRFLAPMKQLMSIVSKVLVARSSSRQSDAPCVSKIAQSTFNRDNQKTLFVLVFQTHQARNNLSLPNANFPQEVVQTAFLLFCQQ